MSHTNDYRVTLTLEVEIEAESRDYARIIAEARYPGATQITVHKNSQDCPYDSHNNDCTCQGMGGDR